MKKIIAVTAAVAALLVIAIGSLVLYVYTRNFGVDYKGRARLDYNWKYYFAACPKDEYLYHGKHFSFAYPKFHEKNPLREVKGVGNSAVLDGYLLSVFVYEKIDGKIKDELSKYLACPDGPVQGEISKELMRRFVGSGPLGQPAQIEKIRIKGGGAALLFTGRRADHDYLPGLEADFGHRHIFLVGFSSAGVLVDAEFLAPLDISEEDYREIAFGSANGMFLNIERDAQGACVFDRFIKTFEIK